MTPSPNVQKQNNPAAAPVAPMGGNVPVPPRPNNFGEYMNQLQQPIKQNNIMGKLQDVQNKIQPYTTTEPVNLNAALGPQVNNLLSNEVANQKKEMTNKKALAGLNEIRIKYQQSLLQQELAERSLFTKYSTERLQASAERVQNMKNMKIDPSRFFKDMNSWQRVVGFIGIAAAGIMHARAGYDPNEVVMGINNIIEQDVIAQTRDFEMAKFEHQQININDTKQLAAMKELITGRSHIRTNLAALALGQIKDMKDAEEDQKKASELGMLHQTFAKTYIQKAVEDKFQEKAIENTIKNSLALQVREEAGKKFAGAVTAANPSIVLGMALAPSGEQPYDEKFMATGTMPAQIKTMQGETRPPNSDEIRNIRNSAKVKTAAQDMDQTKDPKNLDIKRSLITDWRYLIRNIDPFSNQPPLRSIQGAKIYANYNLDQKTRQTLYSERQDNMDTMSAAAQVALMLGGLPKFMNQKVGDDIDMGNFWSDIDDDYDAVQKKINSIGYGKFMSFSPQAREEFLKDVVPDVDVSEGSDKYTSAQKRLADLGVSKDKQRDILKVYAATSLAIKKLTARAISIVTGEEGKRKTKEEQEMAMRFITGGEELSNIAYSDLNIFQRMQIIATGSFGMASSGIDKDNIILNQLVDPGLNNNQVEAAKYKLNDSSLYMNNKIINLIRELQKNHGLDVRPTDVTEFQSAIEKWLSEQDIFIKQNETYRTISPHLNPDSQMPTGGY